jgi:flagellin
VRYQTNDGSTFLQRMDITVTEVGTRGENVTAGNAVATTATVKSHASTVGTKVAAESEQVSGITVANMAEGRQGTLQATGSNSVLSAAFNTFVSKPDYAGGTFTLGNLNGSSDAALFKIDATTGAIETKGLVDYESKTEYNITVTYTTADANSPKTYTEDVTIRVADDKVDNTTHITNVDLGTQSSSASAVTILDQAINQISSSQAKLGAIQNRLQYNIDNLSKASMLTQTAKGRIMDADFASETSELSKQQILSQAATSMLAQANQSKQSVLALLQ